MELRDYETVLIFTPVISDDETKASIDRIRKVLTDRKTEIIYEEAMGLRKLAYPIDNKKNGVYHLFEMKAAPSMIAVLDAECRRDETVLRFLTVALDKHAIAYNEKRRNPKVSALSPEAITPEDQSTLVS